MLQTTIYDNIYSVMSIRGSLRSRMTRSTEMFLTSILGWTSKKNPMDLVKNPALAELRARMRLRKG